MNKDFPISELRFVKVFLKKNNKVFLKKNNKVFLKNNNNPIEHMCHVSQVEKLVETTINLHYVYGNPHNGVKLDIWYITVESLQTETDSYWWCVPDLSKNNHPDGAQLNQTNWTTRKRVWAHPKLIKLEAEDRAEEEREEYNSYINNI